MKVNAITDKDMSGYPEECRSCSAIRLSGLCGIGSEFVVLVQESALPITYPKGATIFQKSQPPKGIHILCEGRVKLGDVSPQGRGLISRIANPGYWLGLAEALDKRPYTFTAEALEPVKARFIPFPEFGRLRDSNPQVTERIINQISDDLSRAHSSMIRSYLYSTGQAKLASLLVECSAWFDTSPDGTVRIPANLTHQQIGQLIGVARETLSRVLAEFRDAGAVRMKGGMIEILDIPRLREYIAQDGRKEKNNSRKEPAPSAN